MFHLFFKTSKKISKTLKKIEKIHKDYEKSMNLFETKKE